MEEKIRYIVHLKDGFYMPGTTVNREFCGWLEYTQGQCFYFRLHASNGLVIIPHSKIEWMAPSRILFKLGYNKEDI